MVFETGLFSYIEHAKEHNKMSNPGCLVCTSLTSPFWPEGNSITTFLFVIKSKQRTLELGIAQFNWHFNFNVYIKAFKYVLFNHAIWPMFVFQLIHSHQFNLKDQLCIGGNSGRVELRRLGQCKTFPIQCVTT